MGWDSRVDSRITESLYLTESFKHEAENTRAASRFFSLRFSITFSTTVPEDALSRFLTPQPWSRELLMAMSLCV